MPRTLIDDNQFWMIDKRYLRQLESLEVLAASNRKRADIPHDSFPVVPVQGVLFKSDYSWIASQLYSLIDDPAVKAIVLDVDSPGGTVSGVDELSSAIFSMREQKPIIASVNSLAASAAYYIASAASEVVITPTGAVGSIGVFAIHADFSRMLEEEGIAINFIFAGRYKTEGNPFEPLGDDAKAQIQSEVDHYYSMFVSAVARNRGTTTTDVIEHYGEGRLVLPEKAVSLGMADRVEPFEEVLLKKRIERRGAYIALLRRYEELCN